MQTEGRIPVNGLREGTSRATGEQPVLAAGPPYRLESGRGISMTQEEAGL